MHFAWVKLSTLFMSIVYTIISLWNTTEFVNSFYYFSKVWNYGFAKNQNFVFFICEFSSRQMLGCVSSLASIFSDFFLFIYRFVNKQWRATLFCPLTKFLIEQFSSLILTSQNSIAVRKVEFHSCKLVSDSRFLDLKYKSRLKFPCLDRLCVQNILSQRVTCILIYWLLISRRFYILKTIEPKSILILSDSHSCQQIV